MEPFSQSGAGLWVQYPEWDVKPQSSNSEPMKQHCPLSRATMGRGSVFACDSSLPRKAGDTGAFFKDSLTEHSGACEPESCPVNIQLVLLVEKQMSEDQRQ